MTTKDENVTVMKTTSRIRLLRRRAVSAAALILATALMAVAAAPAHAGFGIAGFDGMMVDAGGEQETQAGAHPYAASVSIQFNTTTDANGMRSVDGMPKNAFVDLPAGLVGNPRATPRCSEGQLEDTATGKCPDGSQVGVIYLDTEFGDFLPASGFPPGYYGPIPVYNMVPSPGVPAEFAFNFSRAVVHMRARVRSDGDYGISIDTRNIAQTLQIRGVHVTMWGVPADPSHDSERGVSLGNICNDGGTAPCPAHTPPKPFLTSPTNCAGGPLETSLTTDSWENSGQFVTASFMSHFAPPNASTLAPIDGCDRVPFDPAISVEPSVSGPGAPTGLTVEISMPVSDSTAGLAQAHLKRVALELPEGMTVNPSSANGLGACSPAQLARETETSVPGEGCPGSSKVGTVAIDTPLLDERMEGSVYLATQRDNPFGSLLALYIVARGPGVVIKLPGKVETDARTGQIRAIFDNNPQLPFERLAVKIKGGPNASLVNPTDCGPKVVSAAMSSWAMPGESELLTDAFTVDCPGLDGFAPSLLAGTISPTGGRFSPFALGMQRPDGEQYMRGLSAHLPEGLLAQLEGVPLCADAQASAGACPVGSRVGRVTVGAGAGPTPFFIDDGSVYLTGPYKGAPYGLAVAVRAVAGPLDLGTVVVRQALHVDPADASVTAVSDPLPTILEGIPLQLRDIRVDIDRDGFTINPTSCEEKRIEATLTSVGGAVHRTGSRFQAADCQALPFEPRLGLRLTGRRQRVTGRHPGVRAVVRQSGVGEAGIERARVALPKSLALDPENAQALCEYEDGIKPDLENHCPKGSIVGRARAKTPLLNEDLVGDVYFVKNVKHSKTGNLIRTLPMIVVALRGEIAINLKGVSSTTRSNRLVNTFAQVPDAPISRFNLNIKGGKSGILAVTRTRRAKINLCTKPRSHIANNRMNGQNGKRAAYRVRVKTPCGGKRKAAARSKKGKAGRS